jgi:8-oxo-dGTP pyrophosphatase MutT (NUDIX family)
VRCGAAVVAGPVVLAGRSPVRPQRGGPGKVTGIDASPHAPRSTASVPAPVRLDETLRGSITGHLAAHDRLELPVGDRRRAAVAVLLVDAEPGSDDHDPHEVAEDALAVIPSDTTGLDGRMVGVAGGASFVLCRRSAGLGRHASQWALPGGRLDEGETPVEAALRETHEEVGVELDEAAVLGLLDDYATRSGYVITPVVVWAGAGVELRPDPGEVLAAYRIGLHQLLRVDSPRFVSIPESDRPVVQVPLGGDLIHAPTGALLVQFRWVALEGRLGERVVDFEQPVFAWG